MHGARLGPVFGLFFLLTACRLPKAGIETDYQKERELMVEQQLAAEGIHDTAVLAAMRKVPRHEFVSETPTPDAYRNGPLPIGHGQTISQPFVVAYMTEALRIKPGIRILEIGTGSAYQTAILAELGAAVYTIEVVPELCVSAAATLKRLGYSHVQTRCGDGYAGWKEAAPFDRVLLTAAPPEIPPALLAQLRDGGILVAPVGSTVQKLVRIIKQDGKLREESLLPVRFVPMVHP